MADQESAELLVMLRKAKAGPLPFAFGVGKTPATSALLVHKSKRGASLLGQLRSENAEIKKGAFGTLKLDGKTVCFTFEKEVSGVERLIKQNFKALHLNLKVRVDDDERDKK